MRLRYWGKLVNMQEHRIPKIVYKESKKRMQEEIEAGGVQTKTWCSYTKKLLEELELGEWWEREGVEEGQWKLLIKKRIHTREENHWREEISQKPKLRTYVKIKN